MEEKGQVGMWVCMKMRGITRDGSVFLWSYLPSPLNHFNLFFVKVKVGQQLRLHVHTFVFVF